MSDKVKATFDQPLEVGAGDIYTYNKEIMRNEKPIHPEERKNKIGEIEAFVGKKVINEDKKYFMLLGWEDRYFTVFNIQKGYPHVYNAMNVLDKCIDNIGKLLSIDYEEQDDCYEIWISQNGEPMYYRFFNYDWGVAEC